MRRISPQMYIINILFLQYEQVYAHLRVIVICVLIICTYLYAICVARFRLLSKACFWVVYMAELFTHWPLNARKAGSACL